MTQPACYHDPLDQHRGSCLACPPPVLRYCGHLDCPITHCIHKEDRSTVFQTKDSGKREEYESGMVRDTEEGKARFDLLLPKGVPYANQMLTRFAELMARGAGKYGDRNWEKARGQVELDRYRSSALRHLQQWAAGEDDEDHAAAVMFNLMAGETVKFKMEDTLLAKIQRAPLGIPASEMRRTLGLDPDPEMC